MAYWIITKIGNDIQGAKWTTNVEAQMRLGSENSFKNIGGDIFRLKITGKWTENYGFS